MFYKDTMYQKNLLHNRTFEIVLTFLKYFLCYVTKRFLPQPLNVEVKTNKQIKRWPDQGLLEIKVELGFKTANSVPFP